MDGNAIDQVIGLVISRSRVNPGPDVCWSIQENKEKTRDSQNKTSPVLLGKEGLLEEATADTLLKERGYDNRQN